MEYAVTAINGIIQLALALLGVHVSLRTPDATKHRKFIFWFVALGTLSLCLTVAQQYVTSTNEGTFQATVLDKSDSTQRSVASLKLSLDAERNRPIQVQFTAPPSLPTPRIQQTSSSPSSPNTAIIGDNNVVNNEPPARRLSDLQKASLVAQLSSFPKIKVRIFRLRGGPELQNFAADFKEVFFDKLKWTMVSDIEALDAPKGTGLGIQVSSQDNHPEAVDVLVTQLKQWDFEVEPVLYKGSNPLGSDEMLFIVAPNR